MTKLASICLICLSAINITAMWVAPPPAQETEIQGVPR